MESRKQDFALSLGTKLAKLGYVCFTPEYRLSTEALYPAVYMILKPPFVG
jgi:acetyl esterase/lipase